MARRRDGDGKRFICARWLVTHHVHQRVLGFGLCREAASLNIDFNAVKGKTKIPAVVNAVYHRSYEIREPIEVRITRDDLVVLSFPGPDHSIRIEELRQGKAVARRYRNRRVGEFLKELDLTEGRSTGISKILRVLKENGAPPPEFDTDADRSFFLIRLPVHPDADLEQPEEEGAPAPRTTSEKRNSWRRRYEREHGQAETVT